MWPQKNMEALEMAQQQQEEDFGFTPGEGRPKATVSLDVAYLVHIDEVDFPRDKETRLVRGLRPPKPFKEGGEQKYPNGVIRLFIEMTVLDQKLPLAWWLNWPWNYDKDGSAPYNVAEDKSNLFTIQQIHDYTANVNTDDPRYTPMLAVIAMNFGWEPYKTKTVTDPITGKISQVSERQPLPGFRSLLKERLGWYKETKNQSGQRVRSLVPASDVRLLSDLEMAQSIVAKLNALKQVLSSGAAFTEPAVIAAVQGRGHVLSGGAFAALPPEEMKIVVGLLRETCQGREIELPPDYVLLETAKPGQPAGVPQATPKATGGL